MIHLSRPALLAAGIGGLAWTVKALVITARDDSFGVLEAVLFVGGLAALVAAAVLIGWHVARGRSVVVRVLLTAATAFVLCTLSFLFSEVTQPLVREAAPGSNLGLEQEGGILLTGLAWLAIAAVAATRRPDVPRAVLA